jgi:tetratricopeptide (TPR) repeat protein
MLSASCLSTIGALVCLFFLAPVNAYSADNWIEVRSPHFTVNTNAGEKDARKIADQFEQIRQMFHSAFAGLRVDPAQPIIIVAAKNENTMKLFLPEEWETKGHIRHAGIYQQGEDKDYVLLRLDTEGDNPFHTLYHEYTHALLRLNFRALPIWLNEGLAEFFGNSTLGDKEVKTGTIDSGHLYLLNQSKLIPIETLLEVGHDSPYYNEKDRASVFYAESWAVVHFLMMNPEARQKQLLKNFFAAFEKSGDQVQAAQESFGDLKQFGKRIEGYARQSSFQIGLVKVALEASNKNLPTRSLSPAEALALRGDFFAHHNRLDQAKTALEEAVKTEPNLAFAHEALGYYHYRRQETSEADEEMREAMRLGATGFVAPYYHAVLLLRNGGFEDEAILETTQSLEKAIKINPQFAPAYEWLSQAYSRSPKTQVQAVNAAIQAVKLDPATLPYSINLTYLLINSNRFSEAHIMVNRIQTAANSQPEKEMANTMLHRLEQAEQEANTSSGRPLPSSQGNAHGPESTTETKVGGLRDPRAPGEVPVQLKFRGLAADGPISAVDCSKKPDFFINVDIGKGPVSFHAVDFAKISLSWADGSQEPTLNSCSQWKGRKVKVWFSATPGKEYAGEITKLFFY